MIKKISIFIFLIIFTTLPQIAYSQVTTPNHEQLAEEVEQERQNINRAIGQLAEEVEQERQNINEYNTWVLRHTKNVFILQYIKSIIIFFVVLIIVFTGLYFSFIQFKRSTNILNSENSNSEINTTLKIGAGSIEVSSSILGLLILVISLAFLYLYLEEVHRIEILPPNPEFSEDFQSEET